jgi:uncharacterized protein YndB with AHSA1/START domain
MGVLATATVGFLLIGFLLPSTWEAEAERTISAPASALFPLLDQARGWPAWTPSPETGLEFFGPDRGEGGGYLWDDPGYGKGRFTLTTVNPDSRIAYRVEVEGGSITIEGTLTLEPSGEGTRVLWRESGDFGWNPLLGYLAGRMATLQGEQLGFALENLETQVLEQLEAMGPTPDDEPSS